VLQSINELGTPSTEPPLKKFKALFEESDPDRLALSLPSDNLDVTQESHPPPQSLQTDNSPSQEEHRRIIQRHEASQVFAVVESRGTKRRAGIEDLGDGPLHAALMEQESPARPLKRRMVEGASRSVANASSEHSQIHEWATLGEPDTDKRFLTALASMKKGKKSESLFDREFNNLRISKPDIEREILEQEWDLLDGLDDEHNIRGNFMQVVELGVYKKGGAAGTGTTGTGRIDWEGKPDFKKFRKVHPSCIQQFFDHRTDKQQKNDPRRRPPVELVMNQGNDYGVGSGMGLYPTTSQSLILLTAYWEDDPDSAQADEFLGYSQASSKARAHQPQIQNSDGEDQFPVILPTKRSTRTTKGKVQGSRQEIPEPLFLSSEDEEVLGVTKQGEDDDRDEGTETLRSAGSSRKSGVQRGQALRVAMVVDDDDSDDGTTFKGFGTKPRPSRR
jgi:hypothetical protein